jgi:hypothetical protein
MPSIKAKVEVPPPEERMCTRHNKPICPSKWRNGFRNSGCSRCGTEVTTSPTQQARRKRKWDSKLIFCIIHPDRRCNRSTYIKNGHRHCSSCNDRLEDNSYRPQVKQKWNKREMRRIMERRRQGSQFHHSALRGFDLFSRIVGDVPGFNC